MSSSGKFSFWVAVSFTINYVIGSGFLTLPWAFGEAGLLLSCSVMLIFGLFSIISVLFILETTERIRVIQSSQRNVNLFHLASNGYQHVLTSEKTTTNNIIHDRTDQVQDGNQYHRFEIDSITESPLSVEVISPISSTQEEKNMK
jgi:hypothetical protein